MRIALIGAELEENLAVRYIRAALSAAGHDVAQIVFNSRDETDRAARVNLNTCGCLEELADAADGPALPVAEREKLVAAFARRAQADDAALTAEGDGLLFEIRRIATLKPRHEWSGWPQKAAAVTLAATLALGATGCGEKGGHVTEMAPVPAPVADPALLRPQFDAKALPLLAQTLRPARDVVVELRLDQQARVASANFQGRELGAEEQKTAAKLVADLAGKDAAAHETAVEGLTKLGPTALLYLETAKRQTTDAAAQARLKKLIDELLDQLTGPQAQAALATLQGVAFQGEAIRGKRFVFNVSKEQLEQAWKRQKELMPPPEMAPMPPNTHPHERVPVPPAKKAGDAALPPGMHWTEEVAIPPWMPPSR